MSVNATTLVSSISPSTGTSATTAFSVKGTGATASGGVTASIIQPDGSTALSQTTANSSGQFAFNSFMESQVGTYSEVDTDVKTGAQSNTLVWTVIASPGAQANVPSAPQNLAATGGNGQVSLSWSAPASNGGAAISSYVVFRGTQGGLGNQSVVTSGGCANLGATLSCTDTGLSNGTTYYYSVLAANSAGPGPASNQISATPMTSLTAAPSISSVSPSTYAASMNNQTMTINGANFVSGDTLTFVPPEGGTIASTPSKLTVVSGGQISYQFDDGNDPGTWSVRVNSPDGTLHSGVANFTVP
jgi:hypothetical protein